MSVRLPKYRYHKGSGQALIQIEGRRIYLGPYNSPESKEKYRQYIAQLASPSKTVHDCQPENMLTVNALVLSYYRYAQTYYVKNGRPTDEVHGIRAGLSRMLEMYGRTRVMDFGPKAFKLVREAMIQEGLNRKYINKLMGRIRRMFKWGVAEELLPPSISQALESVPGLRKGRSEAVEGSPVQPLPHDTLEATQEGRYITKETILEIYDEIAEAIRTGQPYQTRLDPPPGPPTDAEGNFIPMAQWDKNNWPSHIHPPREEAKP